MSTSFSITMEDEIFTVNPEDLTPEQRWRLEHMKIHEQHKGHESMHAEMILILLVTLIVAQVVLVEWKKRHFKSYQTATLIGMWVIPFVLCLKNQWWRFIFTWLIFSCITSLVARKALQKPVQGTTPRLVYKWFYLVYKLSCGLGLLGYILMMATMFGLNLLFDSKSKPWMDAGFLLLFYGLYYGVLGRDLAEICADKMATHVGYYTAQGMPTRHLESGVCAVCGNKLLVSEDEEGVLENTYKLSCNHEFHEFCIRGWCIIGKKQTCPYCKEKVDLKKMFCNPYPSHDVLTI
ncbi:RING finger protein 121 isoform X3 [Ischnura elegans]|uniref:RING finger protein 121 isoform X3 n=1 Tax=Ischnura elegans TaxID=197161 RepID=UPI001ED8BA82|nr:RING finger protein 121 isoform X3 [Ischnura elegans]